MGSVTRTIVVNGAERAVEASPEMRLLDFLREALHLTGTKEGCGEGECGACSVLVNGEAVNACLVLFGQLSDGDRILTVEGLGEPGRLSPLQESFIREGGVQCGICTPGILMAAHALLLKNPRPTRQEIAEGIAGNLCRCTGYARIIDAIERAAALMRGERP